MKRVVFLVAALFFCTSSVFAWNAESFTNGSVYEYEPVMAARTFSLDDGVAVVSDADTSSSTTSFPYSDFITLLSDVSGFLVGTWKGVISIPEAGLNSSVYESIEFGSWAYSTSPTLFSSSNIVSAPSSNSSTTWDSWQFPFGSGGSISFTFTLPDGVQAFSMSGVLKLENWLHSADWSFVNFGWFGTLNVLCDGRNVLTLYGRNGVFDFNEFIYNGIGESLSTVSFVLSNPSTLSGDWSADLQLKLEPHILNQSNFVFTVLNDLSVLDGFNDQAQDNINEHESVESQWTGSMTENFNALDMDSFSFPDGLVSAFALITGIFNDLWNAMGDYKIIFVFPLTLAIALLLVGRISKFAGTSGSGKNKGGDDGA